MRYLRLERARFAVLAAFIVFVFLTGGGSRNDIQSLVILRPLAVLMCAFGCVTLTREQIKQSQVWFGLFLATLALPLIHLVPLPPGIWQALPGREIIVELDKAIGIAGVWRPLTLTPDRTWNAVFALSVPLAVFVLGIQLSPADRSRLVPCLLFIGLASALLGLMQAISPGSRLLYFYAITNVDAAVGLFANRNHQAFLLAALPPLLTAWAVQPGKSSQQLQVRSLVAAGGGILLLPMILVTGSRAGLILMMLSAVAATIIYRQSRIAGSVRRHSKFDWRLPTALALALLIGIATLLASRGEALQRLLELDVSDDLRFEVLPLLLDLTRQYLPWGSGLGSFVEVFRLHEPDALLAPQYLNHAHNDLVELALTAGIPGLALLVAWLLALARATLSVFVQSQRAEGGRPSALLLGRAAAVGIAVLLLASLTDYPLRTPSLAATFGLLLLWLNDARRAKEG